MATHYYDASHLVAWSVGLCVALSVCNTSEPCKIAETTKLPFGFRTRVGPMNHVLHEIQMPTWGGAILRGKQANRCKVQRRSAIICANTAEPIDVPFGLWARMGPKALCVTWESRSPIWRGQFWWIRAPTVNYRHFLQSAVQKRFNRSICRLGCGLEWAEECTNSIVFARWRQCARMGGHVLVSYRITLNHPSTSVMRLMSNYFDYLSSLDTPT